MEGKETQDPWELNYDVGPESWFTPEVEQWRYIAGLSSWKQTASSGPIDRYGEKNHLPDQ